MAKRREEGKMAEINEDVEKRFEGRFEGDVIG